MFLQMINVVGMVPNIQIRSMESCCSSKALPLIRLKPKLMCAKKVPPGHHQLLGEPFWTSKKVLDLSPCPSNTELEANHLESNDCFAGGTGVGELPAMGNCSGAKQPQPGLDQT